MNQEIRNRLRNVVTQCRKLLEDSVSQELEGKYGIFAKKDEVIADPNVKMIHLSEEERAARRDILDHFGHIKARGFRPKEALHQLVREIAFTHLNRLCAYKMMEAREVYVGGQKFREAVSRGINSNGVKFYLADHPEEERLFNTGYQDVAYRHFLDWLGGLLSEEIGVLFNPNDPANRLYPRQKTLDEVLEWLNGGGVKPEETELREEWPNIWSQDETIGWVYQYFTPKEMRDQARKESATPRNSYELAFRNQFFTPRYVVEFLTDNTLGRIWYEMRKGETSLAQSCLYLVRRSHPVFLAPGQQPPGPLVIGERQEAMETNQVWIHPPAAERNLDNIWHYALTVDGYEFSNEHLGREYGSLANERLEQYRKSKCWTGSFQELRCCLFFEQRRWRHFGHDPEGDDLVAIFALFDALCERWNLEVEYISDRRKQDPRDLKVLDPACGSGHFLLYCFDLFQTIYEEAYSDPDLAPALKKDYETLEDLRRDVPRLILARNLHGIDIDQRASQIAALALWLRCQRAYHKMGLKKDRPKITRSNFVCAEPMPGEEQMLKEFVGQLEPKLLGQVVEVVFDKMKLAGEAGSLLRIEEEIKDAVSGAKRQWIREALQATDRKGQPLLFRQTDMDRLAGKPEQPALFDLTDITDDQFFEQAETKVIEALRQYAEKAQNGLRLQKRLFSEDAVRGFAFVDLCHKRFDVVLMNPPFGSGSGRASEELTRQFPQSASNLFAMFVVRANELITGDGVVGVLTPRTFLTLASFENYRGFLLNKQYSLGPLADLGWEVLDGAQVEVCAFVIGLVSPNNCSPFFDLSDSSPDQRADELLRQLTRPSLYRPFMIATRSFEGLPKQAFSYRLPIPVFSAYLQGNVASKMFYSVFEGAAITGADRFHRLWWEVSARSLQKTWFPLAHGGDFAPYFRSIVTVIDWEEDGRGPKDEVISRYPYFNGNYGLKIKHEDLYFQRGLSYGKRTDSLNVSVMPDGCVFSHEAQAVFPKDHDQWRECLAFLNSAPARYCANQICEGHKLATYISSLPCSAAIIAELTQFRTDIDALVGHRQSLAKADETARDFCIPSLLADVILNVSLAASASYRLRRQLQTEVKLIGVERSISKVIDKHLDTAELRGLTITGVSKSDRNSKDHNALDVTLRDGYLASACKQETLSALDSAESEIWNDPVLSAELRDSVSQLMSYLVGVIVGRWDIWLAFRPDSAVGRQDVFDAFSICSPGMLQDEFGLPKWENSGSDYPISVDWDGILVDSADQLNDVALRVQAVVELIWNGRAEDVEQEACKILGAKDLREYFRRPGKGGFWGDHIARYTVSRRKAPIYWLLQSSKTNYAIWLYYHRLDKDLLFKALVNHVEPKIRLESSRLDTLRTKNPGAGNSGKEAKRFAKEAERQEDFLTELQDFEDKLRRAANLYLVPDLNDGVLLNVAPLWELVPWKEAKNCWEELREGKYGWSSIGKQLRQKGLVK